MRSIVDDEHGGLGLKFIQPHKTCSGRFRISDALLLAHDVLEHQQGTGKIGSIGDEMIALGGICFTRGQFGELRRDRIGSAYSPEESSSHDITYMAEIFFEQNVPFRQKLVRSKNDDPTGCVDNVIECARANWNKTCDFNVSIEERDTYLESCRLLLTQGALMAERRFESAGLANEMFWVMEKATDSVIKHLECEGQEFSLGYDFSGRVTLTEVYPYD